ncbi:MAG: hypothetical protein Kow0069_14190 [Promethearchaeota archaeon]
MLVSREMKGKLRPAVSVTHGEDLDGLAAQALFANYWEGVLGRRIVEFHRENYATAAGRLRDLAGRLVGEFTVVLTDLGFNEEFGEPLAQLAGRQGVRVVYFDHHEPTRRAEGALRDVGVRCYASPDEFCAAATVQRVLLPGDPHAKFLAREASASDLRANQSRANLGLSRTIGAIASRDVRDERLGRIVDVLREPSFYDDPWLWNLVREYERAHAREASELRERARFYEVTGDDGTPVALVAWTWSDLVSTGDQTRLLQEWFGEGGQVGRGDGRAPDLFVAFNSNGKASFRSASPDRLDAAKLAAAFGGGGHADRAAFNRGVRLEPGGVGAFAGDVLKRLADLLPLYMAGG